MTFTYSNSIEFSLQICLIPLKQFFKKLNVTDDLSLVGWLGCWSISLKMFILNIVVFLCSLNSLTNLINFSFSQNWLNTFPWWYATDIMPFLFVRRIFSYCFMISASSSGFSTFSAFSFSSSVSTTSLMVMESISSFSISSLLSRLVFLVFSEPLRSYKQKINAIP